MLIFKGVCFWCPNTSSPAVGKGNIYPSAYLRVWVLPTPKTIGSRAVNVCSLVKRQIFFNQKELNQPTISKGQRFVSQLRVWWKGSVFCGTGPVFSDFCWLFETSIFQSLFHCSDVGLYKFWRCESTWSFTVWFGILNDFKESTCKPHICSESACLLIFVDFADSWVAFQPKGDHAGPRPWDQTLTNSLLKLYEPPRRPPKQQRLPRNHLNELLPQFLRKRWGHKVA